MVIPKLRNNKPIYGVVHVLNVESLNLHAYKSSIQPMIIRPHMAIIMPMRQHGLRTDIKATFAPLTTHQIPVIPDKL